MRTEARGDKVQREAWMNGDYRVRCDDEGHLQCERCRSCACFNGPELDTVEYPTGKIRVTTDKKRRTLCRECRYQSDVLGNF